MDTKTARRNFYQNKSYLSDKYDQEYTTQKFSEDLLYLLDEYIPNAKFKQLSKFMQKKYNRIVRNFPKIEKPLKVVLKNKFNTIFEQLRKEQVRKILQYIQQDFPNRQFALKGENEYELIPKGAEHYHTIWTTLRFEDILIRLPIDLGYSIYKDPKCPKGNYTLTCKNSERQVTKKFVSALSMSQLKFEMNRGNFQKNANNFIEIVEEFIQNMQYIQNSGCEE